MVSLRFFRAGLGALVAGPIAGIGRYLITPAALLAGLGVAGIATYGFAAAPITAFFWGVGTHTMMTLLETAKTGYDNYQLNLQTRKGNRTKDEHQKHGILIGFARYMTNKEVVDNTPIAESFQNGFHIANLVAGNGNVIYGHKAVDVVEFFNGTADVIDEIVAGNFRRLR